MGVYELSGAGGLISGRTEYKSMNAGNQYGAMVPIAQAVGTASSPVISFLSIPQTFQDLMLVLSALPSNAGTVLTMGLNSLSTGASSTFLSGDGANASSSRTTSQDSLQPVGLGNSLSTTAPLSFVAHFFNYTSTSTSKTIFSRYANDKNGSGVTILSVCLSQSTQAITQINLSTSNGGYFWTTNTTATLYGIRAVSS
jgi:hypothetical protein